MCLLGVCLGLTVKHLVPALWLNIATLWLVLQEEVVAMEAKQAGVGLRRGINHIKGRIFIIIHSWWVISASGHYFNVFQTMVLMWFFFCCSINPWVHHLHFHFMCAIVIPLKAGCLLESLAWSLNFRTRQWQIMMLCTSGIPLISILSSVRNFFYY